MLSVCLITQDEEANLPHTLESVAALVGDLGREIIVVDSGSIDRTLEIAKQYGVRIFSESWKGFAAQKNSAMEKATQPWILSLDADEPLEEECAEEISTILKAVPAGDAWCQTMGEGWKSAPGLIAGYWIARKNHFLGRWIRHGGFYPDRKLRLIRRGAGKWVEHGAHPTIDVSGPTGTLQGAMLHYAYPTLRSYLEHMNSYSSQQAKFMVGSGRRGFDFVNIVLNPAATFLYNYFFRLGFLDGREGFLLHAYHSAYVSWKYAKVWEMTRKKSP
ncbi:MAG TPA: glycosyltransferase family 2 protein [Terriglobales bacterium]|nr:glycosyltransferase family 2 protein [Terriglobales bacterium]